MKILEETFYIKGVDFSSRVLSFGGNLYNFIFVISCMCERKSFEGVWRRDTGIYLSGESDLTRTFIEEGYVSKIYNII